MIFCRRVMPLTGQRARVALPSRLLVCEGLSNVVDSRCVISPVPSHRAVAGAALWSLPVLTAAIAAPGAAASTGVSALTFAAAPLLDVYAPFGTPAVTIRNTTAATYRGPLVLSTPSWSTVVPFTISGAAFATETRSGVLTDTWTLADATVAARTSSRCRSPRAATTRPPLSSTP